MNQESKVPANFYSIVKWAGVFIIIGGIKASSEIILPFLVSLFLSLMLLQAVHWFETKKIPKVLSISLVLIFFFLFIFILGELLGNSLHNFRESIPFYKEKLTTMVDSGVSNLNVFGIDKAKFTLYEAKPGKFMDFLLHGVGQLQKIIGHIFFVLLLMVFLLIELDTFPIKFNAIFSRKGNVKAKININRITNNLKSYLFIKTITSLATGLLIYISLLIIGVEYAVLWATIAFLLNYVPNIGSLIAAIPAVLFSGLQLGGSSMLITGIMYLAINFIIGSVIEPKIMGKGMGLSTAVIFISLIFWGWLFGPIGMFLSVPLTMVLKVFLESNESSKYFSLLIGTKEEAEMYIQKNNSEN